LIAASEYVGAPRKLHQVNQLLLDVRSVDNPGLTSGPDVAAMRAPLPRRGTAASVPIPSRAAARHNSVGSPVGPSAATSTSLRSDRDHRIHM